MPKKDYYQMLNLDRSASEDEIKRAYRKLALMYHPDHHPDDPESEETFKKVGEAYAVLSDPNQRKEYDLFGHSVYRRRYAAEDIRGNLRFEELFRHFGYGNEVFGRGFCGKRGRGCGYGRAEFLRRRFPREFVHDFPEKGEVSGIYELRLTPDEALLGIEKQIIIGSQGEQKEYSIRIPRGVIPGTVFRVVLNESEDREILLRVTIA